MLSFKSLIKTVILVLSVLASSTDSQDSKTSFTLHQVESKRSVKSGSAAELSTYHKYNRRAPENVESAAAVNHGTVMASPYGFDTGYLTPITIGGQTLNLVIDTGSEFFWALSSDFDSLVHPTYNSSISNTSSHQEGQTWHTCYEDQSCVYGDVYTETISMGDIVVNNQTIGVAKEVTSNFLQPKDLGGIVGLSFNQYSIEIPQYTSFLDNIKSTLSAPLFTADLKKGRPGSYDFGFIDDSKYTGDITYVPVDTNQGQWEFVLKGYAIGAENSNSVTINVVADTGTTMLFLPEQIVEAYYADVPSAFYNSTVALYVFPCSITLPSITFDISNYKALVPGPYMHLRPLPDDNTTCLGGIQSGLDESFILGDIFLKSQFVVFDAGNAPRLGFAAKPL